MNFNRKSLVILDKYPFLLPRSNERIWEGFLRTGLPDSKIRIDVPNYPLLQGAVVYCPPIWRCELSQLPFPETYSSLLSLIDNIAILLPVDYPNVYSHLGGPSFDRVQCILKDFNEIGKESVLEVDEDFESALLVYEDIKQYAHKMKVTIPREYGQSFLVISEIDLPEEVLPQLRPIKRIPDLFESFKGVVTSLVPFWQMCDELEEETWVVDPQVVKREDTHRRIYLNDKISVVITFNPADLESLPQVQFMGAIQAVAEAREKYQMQFEMTGWDSDLTVVENLSSLLDIKSFPKKPSLAGTAETVGQDCFICFSITMDNEPPPSKWCPNDKCSSIYHFSCLLKWLESVPTSKLGFDHISGSCPYCNEKVLCPINKS